MTETFCSRIGAYFSNTYGQVNWPLPEISVDVLLLANALAVTNAVPVSPLTHCTVTVPVPVDTIFAIVTPEGLATVNPPL
jgi:hypothetical protein